LEFQLDQAIEVLTRTPSVLGALLRGESPAWLNCRKTPESFSPIDVIGHLIHAEMTNWIPRVQLIMNHQNTMAFESFDRFAFQSSISGKTVEELLDTFAELRKQSLHTLADLGIGEPQLDLSGLHPDFGRVTLRNLLATWVVHDLGHIAQILKTMAGEYRDAVGPWRAYLKFLD
jgi:hypothetical protein